MIRKAFPLTQLGPSAIISTVALQGVAFCQGAFDASLLFASCMLCTMDLRDGQNETAWL